MFVFCSYFNLTSIGNVPNPDLEWLLIGASTIKKATISDMNIPNPLPPDRMTSTERHAELCHLLARGIIRLRQREGGHLVEDSGESCLHFTPDRCRYATPTHRRI